jgi:hypothetical protein
MALDDRDRTFEKALARHLRPSASSGPEANALAGAPADLCPDPEMLAAYHDGALSSEERNLWKQHVVGCDRCQLVLAHLQTPLDIPVLRDAGENVAVFQQPVSAARTVSPARIPRPSPLHSLRWLWLVPAGAIAATLVAWVSLRESKPLPLASSSPVEVAENRQPSVAAPSAKAEPAVPAERKETDREKDQPTAPSPAAAASADRDLASTGPQNQVLPNQQSAFQYAPRAGHGPSLSAQKQEQQIGRIAAGSAGGALDLKKLDAQTAPIVNGRVVGSLAQSAPAPLPPSLAPPSSEPSFLADGSVSAPLKDKAPPPPAPARAPASNVAAAKTQAANADAISAVTETVEVSAAPESPSRARAQEHAMMRAAALQNPHVFWAPGAKQAWRIGPAGSLEHSKDKGITWTLQISGVYTDLVAGSAPSAKVCWIVGASGTILRTSDGGTHWNKLDSPVTNDLAGIRATDATHARIWFAPDLQTGLVKTYQTSDGGRTWLSVASE